MEDLHFELRLMDDETVLHQLDLDEFQITVVKSEAPNWPGRLWTTLIVTLSGAQAEEIKAIPLNQFNGKFEHAPGDNCLVEPEITPEMLRAGISVAEAHFLRAHGAWRDLVVAVYRAMYLSRPSPSGETEVTLSRKDIAENTGDPR